MIGFQHGQRIAQIGTADAKTVGERPFRSEFLSGKKLLFTNASADTVDQFARSASRAPDAGMIFHIRALLHPRRDRGRAG